MKTVMEKLGLKRANRLNKKICHDRVVHLKSGIKKGKYRGELLDYAKYYASWYSWLEANGGTRAASKKPVKKKVVTKKVDASKELLKAKLAEAEARVAELIAAAAVS